MLLDGFVNIFSFFVLCSVAITWLVFARKIYPISVPVGWIILSVGVYFFAIARIFFVLNMTEFHIISEVAGGILFFSGDVLVLYGLSKDMERMRFRAKEIKQVIQSLKNKYLKHQIDEDTLKKLYYDLVKELTEIEIKIKNKNRKRK